MILANALPIIDFVMSMVLPTDVPQAVADRYQMEVMLNYTTKPIVVVTTEFSGCVDAVEMAGAVAGGPKPCVRTQWWPAISTSPPVYATTRKRCKSCSSWPTRACLHYTYQLGMGGTTAPVTVAGCQVIWNVGALVGLVLSQLEREGAPYVMAGWGAGALDMRTTVMPYAGPDRRAIAQATAHSYGLPMFAVGGCSDSKCDDQQAGIEAALTLMVSALCGGNIVHDLGYLESGLCYSLVQSAICDEILGWLEHFVRGVDVNDETLAVDLIDDIGPDGHAGIRSSSTGTTTITGRPRGARP